MATCCIIQVPSRQGVRSRNEPGDGFSDEGLIAPCCGCSAKPHLLVGQVILGLLLVRRHDASSGFVLLPQQAIKRDGSIVRTEHLKIIVMSKHVFMNTSSSIYQASNANLIWNNLIRVEIIPILYLDREPIHDALKLLVQVGGIEGLKQLVRGSLPLALTGDGLELLDIRIHLRETH